MSDDAQAREIISRFEQLKSARSTYEPLWQEIRELIRPSAEDFAKRLTMGANRRERIYDDTPCQALSAFAGGLHGYLTNPSQRWFELTTGDASLDREPRVCAWLETTADRCYDELSAKGAQFHQMLHECYLELGAFGTAVLYSERDPKTGSTIWRTFPLSRCYLAEDSCGIVNTVFRTDEFDVRQAIEKFGEKNLPEKIRKEKDPTKKFEFIHAVFPREDRDFWAPNVSTNKPFASVYVCVAHPCAVKESGYDTFPYQCPRWSKLAGEVYGRSPAMDCIANVRVLNAANRVLMESSALSAAPPILVDSDATLVPIKLAPYQIIVKDPSSNISPLPLGGNIAVNLDYIARLQDSVRKSFLNDLFSSQDYGNRDRVTAQEVAESRDSKMRQIAPMLGRLENELLNPQVERQYNLLAEARAFPAPPPSVKSMSIRNVSPAAQAQRTARAYSTLRFIERMMPFEQIKPGLFDRVNLDNAMSELAFAFTIGRRSIRTDEEIAAMQQARAEQEQMAAATQSGVQAASALKDVATAQEKSPDMMANLAGMLG